jgi:hypothetical protein
LDFRPEGPEIPARRAGRIYGPKGWKHWISGPKGRKFRPEGPDLRPEGPETLDFRSEGLEIRPEGPEMELSRFWAGLIKHVDFEAYESIRFGDIHGTKAYNFIGFGDIHGPKAYKLIGIWSHPWPQTI